MRDPDMSTPWAPVEPPDRPADPLPLAPLELPPARRRRGRKIILGVVVLALLAGGLGAATALRPDRDSTADASTAPTPSPSATAATPTPSGSPTPRDAQLVAAAQAVLDRRATAVTGRDAAAFAATIDPESAEFAATQAEMFESLRTVPYDRWAYKIEELEPFDLPAARQRELGPTAYTVEVSVRYRIEDYDHADARFDAYLTFVERGGAWYIASDSDGDELGHRTQRQLWDFGEVAVVRGERSIVLGLGEQSAMERHASDADAAVPRVTEVWGDDWEQKAVIIAPDSQQHMAALLGADEDRYSQIAAITRAESSLPADQGVADRIVINPAIWSQLEAYGRRIVMTHEVTHVATRTSNTEAMPTWLSEGFADYVGYLGTGIAPHVAAPELFEDVRDSGPPDALPSDDDFEPQNKELAEAYQEAWLACTLIVEQYGGEDELVRFYREAGTPGGAATANLDAAFRDVLATTTAEFTGAWSSYLDELAQ